MVSSDFGKLDVSRHLISGLDWAMAGLATAVVANPTPAARKNSRRFMLVVSLWIPPARDILPGALSAVTMAESRREIQSIGGKKHGRARLLHPAMGREGRGTQHAAPRAGLPRVIMPSRRRQAPRSPLLAQTHEAPELTARRRWSIPSWGECRRTSGTSPPGETRPRPSRPAPAHRNRTPGRTRGYCGCAYRC